MADPKNKRYYLDKDTMRNMGQRDTVLRYLKGVIHQDKMLYMRTAYLSQIGIDTATPFKIFDSNGNIVPEYDFSAEEAEAAKSPQWVGIEVPPVQTNVKQSTKPEPTRSKTKKG